MNAVISKVLARIYFEIIQITRFRNVEYNIVKNRSKNISGWILDDAGYELYKLCKMPTVKTVVELGSWQGKSSTWIASALKDRIDTMLYCVDTWAGSADTGKPILGIESNLLELFTENINNNNLMDHIKVIQMTTEKAAEFWRETMQRNIDLLFIDADHSYDAVRRDFELWSSFVIPGGIIVFDDVPFWPGPTRLCTELEAAGVITVVGRTRNTLFALKNGER